MSCYISTTALGYGARIYAVCWLHLALREVMDGNCQTHSSACLAGTHGAGGFTMLVSMMLAIENTAIIIAALIPWNIACTVPLHTLGVPATSLFFGRPDLQRLSAGAGQVLWWKDG